MKRDYEELRKQSIKLIQKLPIETDDYIDTHGDRAIAHFHGDLNKDEVFKILKRVAQYMDIPHPEGRDPYGENDFAAMRLCCALYDLHDKMDDELKALIKTFFLEKDFTSMYGSENHVFMMRVARYLAAQFYKEDFKQYSLTWQEAMKRDKKYILEFIQFRAKYGLGEFTSAYLLEDIFMVATLSQRALDPEVKNMAQMAVDLIVIEALNNLDKNGCFSGAAGRTYEFNSVGFHATELIKKTFVDMIPSGISSNVFSLVAPDEFIIDAYCNRQYPHEIKEQKHLHSMYAWRSDVPDWAHIEKLHKAGSISKYTYINEFYGIGAICHQDEYPVDETEDYVYAHHQQVEGSLTLAGESLDNYTKLFSHHPGQTDQHRRWTGDLNCCCNQSFANENTLMTIYDIEKEDELDYTHAFIDCEKYDKIVRNENRLFLKKGNTCIFIYVDKPFTIDVKECELISKGRKNCYIFRVETNVDFDAFMEKYSKIPVSFDETKMELQFDGLFINKNENGKIGFPEKYPYDTCHDSDWVYSKWGEGIVYVKNGEKTYVLDFINNRMCKK